MPHLLQENHCLEHLHIEVYHQEGSSLGEEMRGPFPAKLRNLTLTGRGLKSLAPNLIQVNFTALKKVENFIYLFFFFEFIGYQKSSIKYYN